MAPYWHTPAGTRDNENLSFLFDDLINQNKSSTLRFSSPFFRLILLLFAQFKALFLPTFPISSALRCPIARTARQIR